MEGEKDLILSKSFEKLFFLFCSLLLQKGLPFFLGIPFILGRLQKDLVYSPEARVGSRHQYDQIGELYELREDLTHIICECDDIPLKELSSIHKAGAEIEKAGDCEIDERQRHGI